MRYSIRIKLFGVFILMLVIFQLLFLITNAYFLDDIFLWSNKRAMTEIYRDFKERLGNDFNEEEYLHTVNNDFGGNIAVISLNNQVKNSTYSRFAWDRIWRVLQSIHGPIEDFINQPARERIFVVSPNDNERFKTIIFVGKLPDNKLFIAEKPYGAVFESSKIAERFIIISGLGTLLIGSIIVFFLSGRLTKPIIKINDAAKKIAELNFDNKVSIATNDELGALGISINLISDKLSHSLNELREANHELRKDIEKERKLEQMRRKFVSNVSHELKTPISMIQGYADGLKHDIAKSPEESKYYCDVIIDESEKMDRLIRDLLDISSYESGAFKVTKSRFDLVKLIKESALKYLAVLERKNVILEISVPDECIINADRLRIEQIIRNFMSNAEKYVDCNGKIAITLGCCQESIRLEFFNSGEPISDEDKERIWTSFYRVESEKPGANVGTGLGLAIVKAIVDMHGGQCSVINTKEGVNFWVELPISE